MARSWPRHGLAGRAGIYRTAHFGWRAKGLGPSQLCRPFPEACVANEHQPVLRERPGYRVHAHPDRGHRPQVAVHEEIDIISGIDRTRVSPTSRIFEQPPVGTALLEIAMDELHSHMPVRQQIAPQIAAHVPHQERGVGVLQARRGLDPSLPPDADGHDHFGQLPASIGQHVILHLWRALPPTPLDHAMRFWFAQAL